MRPCDFAVERVTKHAWANRSGKPCKLLFVLVDGVFGSAITGHFAAGHRP